MSVTKININPERCDEFAAQAMARANQISEFNQLHLAILSEKSDAIAQWGNEFGAGQVDVENFYSTHMREEAYTEIAQMIGHIKLSIPVRKNYAAQNKKMTDRFKELTGLGIQQEGYGRAVKFQIWF